ncbi:hypothetical protein R84B8_02197 [Treponema sp. R8-4-B8]
MREPVALETGQGQRNTGQSGEKINFFSHFHEIIEIAKQADGINDLFFEFAQAHLQLISNRLCISQTGALLFAGLVKLYDGSRIRLQRLADILRSDLLDIIKEMNELEVLEQKEFIHINRIDEEDYREWERDITFQLRYNVIEALSKGFCPEISITKNLSIDGFFAQLEHLCKERIQKRQSYKNCKELMRKLLQGNQHLVFVKKINNLMLNDDDTMILIRFFHYTVTLDEPEMDYHHLEKLYDNESDFNPVKRKLRNGTHILLEKELIENICSDGFSDSEAFRLTDAVKEEFLIELDDGLQSIPIKKLKRCDSITAKLLFYPEKTQQAIDELVSLIQQKNFINIQKRLTENGMRTGFACLFSGGPGTGKTETAYQIARITGRDIMPVDIANTKSKWFGESEKQIKDIFDKYRSCVKKCEKAPILLFNEADAVIGKRQFLGENHNGPAQTENAIQNIILQEIENLNGILIATTNLSANMDTAFERRFLYKIDFEKPDAEARKTIWRSLISGLSDEEATVLASRFNFSGGQIENIARRSTVHRVLSGKLPVLEELIKFCNMESSNKNKEKIIGFTT